MNLIKRADTLVIGLASVLLTVLSYYKVLPFAMAEVFGFVSGAICVWLVVKENVWNWPIGIINNAFFIYLFVGAKLYADAGLQFVYIAMSLFGLFVWLYGNKERKRVTTEKVVATKDIGYSSRVTQEKTVRSPKAIGNWPLREFGLVLLAGAAVTYWMYLRLSGIAGTTPIWDSITTGLSLMAFWGQCRKHVESWYFWIAADLIYIPLYFYKGLPLTGLLYVVFLSMCLVGLRDWRRTMRRKNSTTIATTAFVDAGLTRG